MGTGVLEGSADTLTVKIKSVCFSTTCDTIWCRNMEDHSLNALKSEWRAWSFEGDISECLVFQLNGKRVQFILIILKVM